MSVNEKMAAIANAIRDKTGGKDALTLDDMATEIPKVYEQGQKDFMEAYQPKVTDNYTNRFSGHGWTIDTFKPVRDMKPTNAYMMFYASQIKGSLPQILKKQGVKIDWSGSPPAGHLFQYSAFTEIAYENKGGTLSATFNQCPNLKKVTLGISATTQFTGRPFYNCTSLTELWINGQIGQNGFDVSWSPLTQGSQWDILQALEDKTGVEGEWVCTFGPKNRIGPNWIAIALGKGWKIAI